MASYVNKLAGLHPSSAWYAAKIDEAINGCTDVTTTIGRTFSMPAEEKVSARKEMITSQGRLSLHLAGLENLVMQNDQGYMVGPSITVADLAVWSLVGWLSGGALDGIPSDYVRTSFPQLTKVCANVDSHPKVQEWKAKHPKLYKA